MCNALGVSRSGFYAWLSNTNSRKASEDARRLRVIRASFKASHGVYGSPRVFLDLREAGETCTKHRAARLRRVNTIRPLHGCRTCQYSDGKPAAISSDLVRRNFDAIRPIKVWVTDITYIRTWEGWMYPAVAMDLFSRLIIGWTTRWTLRRELCLDAGLVTDRR